MRVAAHIPNIVTFLRVALMPVIVLAILDDKYVQAIAVFVVAGATDSIDGYLARKLDAESRFGAYMDPIIDKVFVGVIYLTLVWVEAIPWWLIVLVFGRDLMILAGAAVLLRFTGERDFPPTRSGKLATFFHLVTMVSVMVARATGFGWAAVFARVAMYTAAGATIWSGIEYAVRGIRMARRGAGMSSA